MTRDDSLIAYSLEVRTNELTKVLRQLCKFERHAKTVYLSYRNGTLIVELGASSKSLDARGSWPGTIAVSRKWAEVLSKWPVDAVETHLRKQDTQLWSRDYAVPCEVASEAAIDEFAAQRERRISASLSTLERHGVSRDQIDVIIASADCNVAQLWGEGDNVFVEEILRVWPILAHYGIDSSQIRRALDQKSKDLWKSRTVGSDSGSTHSTAIRLTRDELITLAKSSDRERARLFRQLTNDQIFSICRVWRDLFVFGVEMSAIASLILNANPDIVNEQEGRTIL